MSSQRTQENLPVDAKTDTSIRLLEIDIAVLTRPALLDRLFGWLEDGVPRRIYCLRSGVMVDAQKNPRLKQMLLEADLRLAAGRELLLAARLSGQTVPDLLEPDDWIDALAERLAASGRCLWYLGGPRGAGARWAERMRTAHPGLEVHGRDGSFEKWGPENDRVISAVAGSRPGAVLIGFGSPYQEEYAHAHAPLMKAPLTISVGPLAEQRTGIWPDGPVQSGRMAQAGRWLTPPVRRVVRHLADPDFLLRVLRAR